MTSLGHVAEVDHCRSGERFFGSGVHCHLADKGKRSLAAYHAVGDDIEGVVEKNEGQYVQTGYILYLIFMAYEFLKLRV